MLFLNNLIISLVLELNSKFATKLYWEFLSNKAEATHSGICKKLFV